MDYNVNELRRDTVALIKDINGAIAVIENQARQMEIPVYQVRDTSNLPAVAPLLAAKATAYNTLVMLQSGEARSGRQRTRQ